jgi:hypothetical protein
VTERIEMQKTMRMLTLAGFGMLAGLTLAGTPAQAAPAAGRSAAASTSADQARTPEPDDEVVGYYRDIRSCERAGSVGRRYRAWAHYGCERSRWGSRRAFALIVAQEDWNDRWDNRWRPGSWPGNWPYRPQWPGEGRPDSDRSDDPDRPGSDHPDRFDRPGLADLGQDDPDWSNRPGSEGPDRPDRPDWNGPDRPSDSGPDGSGDAGHHGGSGWGPHGDRPSGSPSGSRGNH